MKLCSVEGCGKKPHSKGLCAKHYTAKWRAENPEASRGYEAGRYGKNPEKEKARYARWRAENPEKFKAQIARRPKEPEKRKVYQEQYRATCMDGYVKRVYGLPKDAPQEILEVYRVILQIKRELKK